MFTGAIRTSSTAPTSFRNRAGNCLLITIAVICVCILVTCGVMIVREYALGNGYAPTTCKVANVTVDLNYMVPCQFCDTKKKNHGKGKGTCDISSFPCAKITVNYTLNGIKLDGMLHSDSLHAIGKYRQCSYDLCLKTKEENIQKVKQYVEISKKRIGKEFNCFYNQDNKNSLIENKKHTKNEVIHSMLWPSVVILICGAIFFKLEMDRQKLTCCGNKDERFITKSKQQDGGVRTCNGKNDFHPTAAKKAGDPNLHRSLEHLSNYSTNKTDYHSTCSKSLSCLDHVGVNGHNKPSAKHHLLHHPAQLQASCSDTGIIKNKVIKPKSDHTQCLIPEIKINDFGTSDSLKSHHETPV